MFIYFFWSKTCQYSTWLNELDITTLPMNIHKKKNELGYKLVSLVSEYYQLWILLPSLPNLGLILISTMGAYESVHEK